MKKKNVINLIKYYSDRNDSAFRNEAYQIASDFDKAGDYQLAEYIMALLSDANTFVPQSSDMGSEFFRKIDIVQEPLPLPEPIENDIVGMVNAIEHNVGINKFLFQGPPGTGKTETAKQLSRILSRELFLVNFDTIIDSKLGQTAKNISLLFDAINSFSHPEKVIILLDEIDSLALDRTNNNDLREMGRATSSVLRNLDSLTTEAVIIATTNLYSKLDKALVRRFDFTIDFGQYTKEDLIEVAIVLLNNYLLQFKYAGKNVRLFRKILNEMETIPYPGELKNMIKTALAFSRPDEEFGYLKKLYTSANGPIENLKTLKEKGYTTREIEILTGVSKSQVARELKE